MLALPLEIATKFDFSGRLGFIVRNLCWGSIIQFCNKNGKKCQCCICFLSASKRQLALLQIVFHLFHFFQKNFLFVNSTQSASTDRFTTFSLFPSFNTSFSNFLIFSLFPRKFTFCQFNNQL